MKKYYLLLFTIFIVGYYLRVMYLPQNALTFGYDQARDAVHAQEIISGNLKILGPPASTPGMHHGVLWYYYLVIPNLFSGGNPICSAYWNALFNVLTLITIYLLTVSMVKSKKAGIISAILYAISYEATQYATWLSNPTLGAVMVPLIYLGLWTWITRSDKNNLLSPVITGLALGFSIHANVFLLFHAIPIIIWILLSKSKVRLKEFIVFVISVLIVTSPMILSEIKFGFKGLTGVLSLLSTQDSIIASKKFGDLVILFLNQIGEVYAYNSIPNNIGYGGLFVIILIIISVIKWYQNITQENENSLISWEPFLATWMLASITVVSVGGASTPFLLVGIGPAVSILIGITIYNWWIKQHRIWTLFVFSIIVISNVSMIIRYNPNGQTRFAIQKGMILSKQLEVVDYTYNEAKGEPFNINALTSPLDMNIVWAYLYKWYGQKKYGYTPSWNGPSQVGQIISLDENKNSEIHFLIIEPMDGIPMQFLPLKIGEADVLSTKVDEKRFGDIVVQKRYKNE